MAQPAKTGAGGQRPKSASEMGRIWYMAVLAFNLVAFGMAAQLGGGQENTPSGAKGHRGKDWREASLSSSEDTGRREDPPKAAGGQFGLSADWREAIQERTDSVDSGNGTDNGWDGLRGEGCMTSSKREEVLEVLEKRRLNVSGKKVAVCLRTKDYARFLPEWLAFHYAIGVDEVAVYDDDSADNTTAVLQPFVEAGFVRQVVGIIGGRRHQMEPLNDCLRYYQEQMRQLGSATSPTYILFHDNDEYIFPVETGLTIRQALDKYRAIRCTRVQRFQYGSSGFNEMPRGLMMETFLRHQKAASPKKNPKVMVNLEPNKSQPVSHLRSMHNAAGCQCPLVDSDEIRINHYLGSRGDYVERLSRYWPVTFAHMLATALPEERAAENTAVQEVPGDTQDQTDPDAAQPEDRVAEDMQKKDAPVVALPEKRAAGDVQVQDVPEVEPPGVRAVCDLQVQEAPAAAAEGDPAATTHLQTEKAPDGTEIAVYTASQLADRDDFEAGSVETEDEKNDDGEGHDTSVGLKQMEKPVSCLNSGNPVTWTVMNLRTKEVFDRGRRSLALLCW
eukprot:g1945.t1